MRLFPLLPAVLLWAQPLLGSLIAREFPHLIIPLKQDYPTTPFGTQYSGEITIKDGAHQVWTEISFDVPSNSARTCKLNFTIATGPQGGPWTLTGDNPSFNISYISPAMDEFRDAWNQNTRPIVQDWVATFQVHYDGSVALTGGGVYCAKGGVAQFIIEPNGEDNASFTWFEQTDPIHGITYDMWD